MCLDAFETVIRLLGSAQLSSYVLPVTSLVRPQEVLLYKPAEPAPATIAVSHEGGYYRVLYCTVLLQKTLE